MPTNEPERAGTALAVEEKSILYAKPVTLGLSVKMYIWFGLF